MGFLYIGGTFIALWLLYRLFFQKKNVNQQEAPQEAIPVPEPEPISKYASMTREEKEAALIDTIYEMAERMERMENRILELEAECKEIKEVAAAAERAADSAGAAAFYHP